MPCAVSCRPPSIAHRPLPTSTVHRPPGDDSGSTAPRAPPPPPPPPPPAGFALLSRCARSLARTACWPDRSRDCKQQRAEPGRRATWRVAFHAFSPTLARLASAEPPLRPSPDDPILGCPDS
ncbi:hypothetical protein PMIN02_013115 [Paraphaeosphaeria minitans]